LKRVVFWLDFAIIFPIDTHLKILAPLWKFLKQTASGSVILVFSSILLVNLGFYLLGYGQRAFFGSEGVAGGLAVEPIEAASLVSSFNSINDQGVSNDFLGFVLLDSSSFLASANPVNSIVPTREGLMIYQVQSGDTISEIAAKFDISVDAIFWANSGLRSSMIIPGQEIVILPVEGVLHETKEGETLDSIADLYGVNAEEIKKFNPQLQESLGSVGSRIIIPHGQPLRKNNYVSRWTGDFLDLGNYFKAPTTGWNWGQLHDYNAVDIANQCGTPVYAAAEGLVLETNNSGWNDGYGNYVKIEHPNKTYTLYAHLNKILIDEGKYVLQGAEIGLMGNTGNTHGPTGCHLHFEIHGAKNPFAKY
jgi:murein DD-endopeptidase MepM/ murein hydrolase activator NlpD